MQKGSQKSELKRYSRLASPYVSLRRKEIFNTDIDAHASNIEDDKTKPLSHHEEKDSETEKILSQHDNINEIGEKSMDSEQKSELEYSLNLNDSWEEGTSSTGINDKQSLVYEWRPSDRYLHTSDGEQQSDVSLDKSDYYVSGRETTAIHRRYLFDKTQDECSDCNKHHKCLKHSGKKIYNCEVCGRGFTTRGNLKNHSLIHTNEKPWQCHICGKRFNRAGNMRTHIKSHSTGKPWQCEDCGRWFKHESGLRHHAKTTCRAAHDLSKNILSDNDTYEDYYEDEKYKADAELEDHHRSHEHDEIDFDRVHNNFISQVEDPLPPLTHESFRYHCAPCQITFNNRDDYESHMLTHLENDKPFICEDCGKCFKRSEELKSHRRTHTGERPYVCHVCQRCFSQPGNLRAHLRTHTGEKPFQCPVCGKTFNRQGNMKTHLRCHSDEKPYRCVKCGKVLSIVVD